MTRFKEAIALFYRGYVKFDGRSTRAEYWWAILFQVMVWSALFLIMMMASDGEIFNDFENSEMSFLGNAAAIIFLIFLLGNILPNIALAVRRFHDLDQTGWLVLVFNLLSNIPLIGLFIALGQLIWYAMPGTQGSNKYGPDPFGHEADVFD